MARTNPYKIKARRSGDTILGQVYHKKRQSLSVPEGLSTPSDAASLTSLTSAPSLDANSLSEAGSLVSGLGDMWELVREQEYSPDFSITIDGEEYSGEEAVEKDLEFISENFGFYSADEEGNGRTYLPFVPEEKKTFGPELEDFEKKQEELLSKSGEIGEKIPGLSKEAVIAKLAEFEPTIKAVTDLATENYSELVDRGDLTEEEAAEAAAEEIEDAIRAYSKNIEKMVEQKIIEMNQQFTIFKQNIESIPIDVQVAIANLAIPPSISAPPSAANPAWALQNIKITKNAMLSVLGSAIAAFGIILKLAGEIKFKLPDSVLSIFDQVQTAVSIIGSIPI